MPDEEAGTADTSELTAFQPEVARLFFALPESKGFLLAGGAALLAQHLTTREGAENLCYLGRCSAERGLASTAGRAGLGPSGRAMISGLWA